MFNKRESENMATHQSQQQFTPLELEQRPTVDTAAYAHYMHIAPLEQRPTVDTAAYAHYMHIAPQTARIHACKESGPIRPLRIPGSAKLHWPTAEIKRVLGVA